MDVDTPATTEQDEVLSGVIATLAKCTGELPDQITPDTDLVADLRLDSLDVLELVMCLEEDFSCDIPDADYEVDDLTVRQLADIVRRHMDRGARP